MTNDELFDRARRVIPGGVNSPVRAFRAVGGTPRFIARGDGPYLFDVDGKRYIDYVGSWGPMILGHAPSRGARGGARRPLDDGPVVRRAHRARDRAGRGDPASRARRWRRCAWSSSGTEATMSAIRLARGFTGRDRIVKFEGCYHGHVDALLVKAGSGAATFGHPDLAPACRRGGRRAHAGPRHTTTSPRLEEAFARTASRSPCVIVEPIAGNMGFVPPRARRSWKRLRELCSAARRAAHLRRGDDRLSRRPRRRAGALRAIDPRTSHRPDCSAR